MPCCHAPHSDRQTKRRVQPRYWERRSPQHCGVLLQLYFLQLYLCVSCISDSQNTMTKSKRRTLYQPHVCIYYSTVLFMYNLSQLGSCNYEQLRLAFLERPSGSSLVALKHFYLHCSALFLISVCSIVFS